MGKLHAFDIIIATALVLIQCGKKESPLMPSASAMAADSIRMPGKGLTYDYYLGTWTSLPMLNPDSSILTSTVDSFDISSTMAPTNFGFLFTGYLSAPADGAYSFYCASDDGSKLFIGDSCIVSNDGVKDTSQEASGTVEMKKGYHRVRLEYFCAGNAHALAVAWKGPGFTRQIIGASSLFHELKPYALLLIAPRGRHAYILGDTVRIRWFYAESPKESHYTKFDLSINGGKTFPLQLFDTAMTARPGDTGSVLWTIPNDTTRCTDHGLLRVSEYDRPLQTDVSDSEFTIKK